MCVKVKIIVSNWNPYFLSQNWKGWNFTFEYHLLTSNQTSLTNSQIEILNLLHETYFSNTLFWSYFVVPVILPHPLYCCVSINYSWRIWMYSKLISIKITRFYSLNTCFLYTYRLERFTYLAKQILTLRVPCGTKNRSKD